MASQLPPKKQVALALLEQASVFVHVDPRPDAVLVPPWFKKQAQLVLQIGLNMNVPIPDLDVGDDGISCTLSFNRSPHHCHLPWTSVFAIVGEKTGRGMVWPDDVPAEVIAQGRATKQKAARPAPKLAAVPDAARAPGPEPGNAAKAGGKSSKRTRARREAKAATKKKRPTKTAVEARETTPIRRGAPEGKRPLPPYLRVIK